jgi:HK97 family phage major capsid protein
MKCIEQQGDNDCGVAVLAMLANVSYCRASDALAAGDYPHPIRPAELLSALNKLAGPGWRLRENVSRPLSDLLAPGARLMAAGILDLNDQGKRRGHWVATAGMEVFCPTVGPVGFLDLRSHWYPDHNVNWIIDRPETASATEGANMAIKITPRLKRFLEMEHGLAAGANDGKARALVIEKMTAGELDAETIIRESTDPEVEKNIERLADRLADRITQRAQGGASEMEIESKEREGKTDAVTPFTVMAKARKAMGGSRRGGGSVSYEKESNVGLHVKTGAKVFNEFGEPAMEPSGFQKSVIGVCLKRLANRQGLEAPFDDDERKLENELLNENVKWVGRFGQEWRAGNGLEVKSILNDTTSGGSYVNPAYFDAALIDTLLLHSELLPQVTVVNVPRGSSIESASVGRTDGFVWGTADGSAGTPFTTDDLINEITDTVYPTRCFLKFGRDILADAAVNIGEYVLNALRMEAAHEIDEKIAVGTGSSQPTGIFTATGLTAVDAANPTTGPMTVGDLEALIFGVAKQYRAPGCCFVGNDASYRRCRAVPAGSDNATRVFGMDHGSYNIMGHPFKIQNDIPDGRIAFGHLARAYRLWRREGWEVKWVGEQSYTLSTSNEVALFVRGRFAGKIVDVNAICKMTNAATQG